MDACLRPRSLAFAAAAALAGQLAAAAAAAGTPALVVDVDTGKVIHAERATDPWYPASVTKLMTAYVALQMVREGRAAMDQLLTLSPEAAAQPPSKMGFRPGTQLTLENALKIIMVKSANDIAMMIAENLGGSVEGFADLMNDTAQRIGMRESHWYNPHGLPDDRQWTSARDMAILGRAILRDFPEHKSLFQIGAIQFGRRVMRNHNGLIGRYPGADGMKTGFICASGFNVVASATRDGRRLIAVVMGSPTANERTLRAFDLFDQGFTSSSWGGSKLEELSASVLAAPPNMRPFICERRGPMPAEEDAQPAALQAAAPASAENPIAPAALAFAAAGPGGVKRVLPPRTPLPAVPVWIGRTPPGTAVAGTPEDGADEAAAPARAKPRRIGAKPVRAARAVASPAADAFIAEKPAAIMDDGSGTTRNKGAITPAASLGPKPPLARPKAGAIAAKPAPRAGAVAAATPAAAKPSPAKPAVAGAAAAKPDAKKADARKAAIKKAEVKAKPEASRPKPKPKADE